MINNFYNFYSKYSWRIYIAIFLIAAILSDNKLDSNFYALAAVVCLGVNSITSQLDRLLTRIT